MDWTEIFSVRDPVKTVKHYVALSTKATFLNLFRNARKNKKSSWKKMKPIFSKFFFKSIGLFRRKFFFSLVNSYRSKLIIFFTALFLFIWDDA